MSGGRNISPRRRPAHDGWRFVDIGNTLNDHDDNSQVSSASYAGLATHQTTFNMNTEISIADYTDPGEGAVYEWTALDRNGDSFNMASGVLLEVKVQVISLDAADDAWLVVGFSNGSLNTSTTDAVCWGVKGNSADSEVGARVATIVNDGDTTTDDGTEVAGTTFFHGTVGRAGTDRVTCLVCTGEDSDGVYVPGAIATSTSVVAISGTARFFASVGRTQDIAGTPSPIFVIGYRVMPAAPTGGKLL